MIKYILILLALAGLFGGCNAKKENINTHQAACDAGNISSCNYLAESYKRGDNGLKVNYEIAAQYFMKACDMQDAFGCIRVADIYYFDNLGEDKLAAKPYYEKALKYYYNACIKKDMKSCGMVGNIHADGIGIPKDAFSDFVALSFYEAACDGGEFEYCYTTGSYYLKGKGVPQNITRGLEYWDKACNEDETGYSCYEIGKTYYVGKIVYKNMVKAKEFFKKGCKRHKFNGCKELKSLEAFGEYLQEVTDAESDIYSFYDLYHQEYGDREYTCESKVHNKLFLVRCYPKNSNYIGNVFVVEIAKPDSNNVNKYRIKAANEISFNSVEGVFKRYKNDIPISELVKIFND
ncbi:MAG: sel1 repeat family protein [Campylobacteraceae bacterium]|jgi:hypothetical protein|nr:sel1 repeat family protein [Campylobacteraceae bacterium]